MSLEIIPETLKTLTLISDIIIVFVVLWFLFKIINNNYKLEKIRLFFKKRYLLFGFIVSLVATLGSLFYSEILKYTPCILCWWQRIFMYPQVLFFGFALIKKGNKMFNYPVILKTSNCDVIGYSSSCSETFFLSHSYITIPMMAMTAFILIIFLGLNMMKEDG
ncbi:disulfide bond formation protein B [Candidatus Woesearchaeota archaeon]|nr:disulfide bond formation protein B [Candidatus Woesearchaeota archaeon]